MARRRLLVSLAAVTAAFAVAAVGAQTGAAAKPKPPPAKPTKVVIIVVDALSKEIVEKYGMANVQALMDDGVDTPRGYLGHTGSVTVVTHNVITSGAAAQAHGLDQRGLPRRRRRAGRAGQRRHRSVDHQQLDQRRRCSRSRTPSATRKLVATTSTTTGGVFTVSPKAYAAYGFSGDVPGTTTITFGGTVTCGTAPQHAALPVPGRHQPALVFSTDLRIPLAGRARQGLRHRAGPGTPLPRDRRPLRGRRRARPPGRRRLGHRRQS